MFYLCFCFFFLLLRFISFFRFHYLTIHRTSFNYKVLAKRWKTVSVSFSLLLFCLHSASGINNQQFWTPIHKRKPINKNQRKKMLFFFLNVVRNWNLLTVDQWNGPSRLTNFKMATKGTTLYSWHSLPSDWSGTQQIYTKKKI